MKKSLAIAVLEQVTDRDFRCLNKKENSDEIKDEIRNFRGAAAGVRGFVYLSETCGFFEKNRHEILDLVCEYCYKDTCIATIVANFDCLNGEYSALDVERDLFLRNTARVSKAALDINTKRILPIRLLWL